MVVLPWIALVGLWGAAPWIFAQRVAELTHDTSAEQAWMTGMGFALVVWGTAVGLAVAQVTGTATLRGLVAHGWAPASAWRDVSRRSKFQEQWWQLAVHLVLASWEWRLLAATPVWWERKETSLLPTYCSSATAAAAAAPGCQQPGARLSSEVVPFFMVQVSAWAWTTVVHLCKPRDQHQKDYTVMLSHHLITLVLVLGAVVARVEVTGLLVVYVHDVSDIAIDVLKLASYVDTDDDGAGATPQVVPWKRRCTGALVTLAFAAAYVGWIYYRLYVLPFGLFPATVGAGAVVPATQYLGFFDVPWHTNAVAWTCTHLLVLVLLMMHVYWFVLLTRILAGLVGSRGHHRQSLARKEYDARDQARRDDDIG